MAIQASFDTQVFTFNFKARTSRGLMKDKVSHFVRLWDTAAPDVVGTGECGTLAGLSIDDVPDYETILQEVLHQINAAALPANVSLDTLLDMVPPRFPSMLFGLETALRDLQSGGRHLIFDNAFYRGEAIPINGLIWMGDLDFLLGQVNDKIAQGFRCIKLKVGGLNFDRECDVLEYIRKRYFRENVEIRLDANGAFKVDDALYKLKELSRFSIHSIEQPLKPGMAETEELCRKSPIPVALDEELIGVEGAARSTLLTALRPQYIILKPSLHGGFRGCRDWIQLAESMGMAWWITSALESSVGLNSICQFAAEYKLQLPQGLGTGMIYENNLPSPLTVSQGKIYYHQQGTWTPEEELW